jgi:hypothetical protein
VVEDQKLAPTRDVADDPLADEGVDEVAALSPELEVRADRQPTKGATIVLPSLREPLAGCDLDVVTHRALRDADLADEGDVNARFLLDLADSRLGNRLAGLDSAAGYDGGVLGEPRDVENEQLVSPSLGMLAGDVGGDGRARSQDCWARII